MKALPHLTAVVALVLLTGCGGESPGNPAKADPTPATSARSGFGSVKDTGDIPDPCGLLSEAEVVELTGRQVTQVDKDGAETGSVTRFCQWQQSGGQLAVFLARTTPAEFDSTVTGATPVTGVGQEAFTLAGHLYVLYGTVQIDVYSRGGTDEENLTDAKKVAEKLFPRI
ncbi:MAG: DUF3558 family protein [Actinoplanes sp.]